MAYIGAGSLDQLLEVLELRETASGVWEWVPVRRAWAQVAQTAKTNLFSKVGVGARDAAVVLRRQPLTLHQALRWKGQHLFLTAITRRDRNHMDVAAALVDTVEVLCQRYTTVLGQDNRPEKQALPELVFPLRAGRNLCQGQVWAGAGDAQGDPAERGGSGDAPDRPSGGPVQCPDQTCAGRIQKRVRDRLEQGYLRRRGICPA